ncbi:reticulon-like protein B8 isoform X2 [Macadamia integrifolia]|uniref:reticulon-like protein B8 isoform X2 n=1 Tax=Macadamia integrifolia TaxID=60698 RepID=UPI001C4F3359|nr:reticulon-like protein B8 isoform X2 [Macadamia integrifolia]XP_042489555.1 reticulon-like protein B8 isoform X2 [Macadamia integrifolia]
MDVTPSWNIDSVSWSSLEDAYNNIRPDSLMIKGKMPEGITAEKLLDTIMDTFADSVPKQKSVSFFEEDKSNSVSSQMNKLFGRQKSIHNILGGGKSADVLLWRNKKISGSVLTGATAVWVLFEWLDYHFLSLVLFALVIGMIVQFVWSNASGILNSSPSKVPRFVVPEEIFVNIGASIGAEVNRFLRFLQDVSCGGNLKQFAMVVFVLFVAAIIGSWCNFLTVSYVGFVAAHTLPVLYERYEDQVDNFLYNVFGQLQNQYRKIDTGVLSKIPKGSLKGKKFE